MSRGSAGGVIRTLRVLALVAGALLAGSGVPQAQATGKLEGRIRNQAGAPIASAQVRIEGTAFWAVAESRGYYFINNIPAGSIGVIARFVGFRPVGTTGLRILAGQTVTQDFALESLAVDIGEIEVMAAVNALVPRDAVTTKQTINGDYAEQLPADRIQNLIALQPGVVISRDGTRAFSHTSTRFIAAGPERQVSNRVSASSASRSRAAGLPGRTPDRLAAPTARPAPGTGGCRPVRFSDHRA